MAEGLPPIVLEIKAKTDSMQKDLLDMEAKARQFEQKIRDDFAKTQTEFDKLKAKSRETKNEWEKNFNGMEDLASALTTKVGATFAGIAASVGIMTKASGDFGQVMNNLQAVSGAAAAEMDTFKTKFMEMGAATKFSSKEVAEASVELAKLGFVPKEITQALDGLVSAASASGESLQNTAEIMAGTLRGFHLPASDAAKVADMLAHAANVSAASIGSLGESMKYIGPIASNSNQKLTDTVGILAFLSNNMINGSQAGTSFRSMIASLLNPSDEAEKTFKKLNFTVEDSQGKLKKLPQIIGELQDKMTGLKDKTKEQKLAEIFGTESLSAVMALMHASKEELKKMGDEYENVSGDSKKASDIMNQGFNYSLTQLKSSAINTAIAFGERMEPALIKVIDAIKALVDWFGKLPDPMKDMITQGGLAALAITGIGTAVGGTSLAATSFIGLLDKVTTALGVTTGAANTTALALKAVLGIPGLIGGGIGLGISGIMNLDAAMNDANIKRQEQKMKEQEHISALSNAERKKPETLTLAQTRDAGQEARRQLEEQQKALEANQAKLDEYKKAHPGIEQSYGATSDKAYEKLKNENTGISRQIELLGGLKKKYTDLTAEKLKHPENIKPEVVDPAKEALFAKDSEKAVDKFFDNLEDQLKKRTSAIEKKYAGKNLGVANNIYEAFLGSQPINYIRGVSDRHAGVDLQAQKDYQAPVGSMVHAPEDMIVKGIQNTYYGAMLTLQSKINKDTEYILHHMSWNDVSKLKVGQEFKQGEGMARVGGTAEIKPSDHWQGVHLHVEKYVNGVLKSIDADKAHSHVLSDKTNEIAKNKEVYGELNNALANAQKYYDSLPAGSTEKEKAHQRLVKLQEKLADQDTRIAEASKQAQKEREAAEWETAKKIIGINNEVAIAKAKLTKDPYDDLEAERKKAVSDNQIALQDDLKNSQASAEAKALLTKASKDKEAQINSDFEKRRADMDKARLANVENMEHEVVKAQLEAKADSLDKSMALIQIETDFKLKTLDKQMTETLAMYGKDSREYKALQDMQTQILSDAEKKKLNVRVHANDKTRKERQEYLNWADERLAEEEKLYGEWADEVIADEKAVQEAMINVTKTVGSIAKAFASAFGEAGQQFGDFISNLTQTIGSVADSLTKGDVFGAISAGVMGVINLLSPLAKSLFPDQAAIESEKQKTISAILKADAEIAAMRLDAMRKSKLYSTKDLFEGELTVIEANKKAALAEIATKMNELNRGSVNMSTSMFGIDKVKEAENLRQRGELASDKRRIEMKALQESEDAKKLLEETEKAEKKAHSEALLNATNENNRAQIQLITDQYSREKALREQTKKEELEKVNQQIKDIQESKEQDGTKKAELINALRNKEMNINLSFNRLELEAEKAHNQKIASEKVKLQEELKALQEKHVNSSIAGISDEFERSIQSISTEKHRELKKIEDQLLMGDMLGGMSEEKRNALKQGYEDTKKDFERRTKDIIDARKNRIAGSKDENAVLEASLTTDKTDDILANHQKMLNELDRQEADYRKKMSGIELDTMLKTIELKRLSAEKNLQKQLKQLQVDQLTELDRLNNLQMEIEARSYEANIRTKQRALEQLQRAMDDLQRQKRDIEKDIDDKLKKFDKEDRSQFAALKAAKSITSELQEALKFVSNPTGVDAEKGTSWKAKREALEAYIKFHKEQLEVARDSEDITQEDYDKQASSLSVLRAKMAEEALRLAKEEQAKKIAMLQKEGKTEAEIDVTRKQFDIENLEFGKISSAAYKEFQELQRSEITQTQRTEREALDEKIAGKQAEMDKTQLAIKTEQNALDDLKQKYQDNSLVIKERITDINLSMMDVGYTIDDVKNKFMELVNKVSNNSSLKLTSSGALDFEQYKVAVAKAPGYADTRSLAEIPRIKEQTNDFSLNGGDGWFYQSSSDMIRAQGIKTFHRGGIQDDEGFALIKRKEMVLDPALSDAMQRFLDPTIGRSVANNNSYSRGGDTYAVNVTGNFGSNVDVEQAVISAVNYLQEQAKTQNGWLYN